MPASCEDLAIVVVNYGSSRLLQHNLAPLVPRLAGVTVVVVDNFSTREEAERVAGLCAAEGWLCEASAVNLGFGSGINLGVARARAAGPVNYLMLNPDAVLTAPSALRLLEAVRADPMTMVAPTVFRPDGSLWFGGADLYLADGRTRSSRRRDPSSVARTEPWLSGACIMVSARLWELVGGFDDDYFLYWEDVDLSHRVLRAGGRLAVSEAATAVHAEGGTQRVDAVSAGTPKSALYYYYNIRNRLLFACRNLDDDALLEWRRATPRVSWEILMEGGRRQLVRTPRVLVSAARGMRDGLRIVRQERRRRSGEEQP